MSKEHSAVPAKSSVEEIRRRFDADVERFSNLDTGQSATIDAPLVLDLIAAAAAAATPKAGSLLDVGCGAGNYTLKLLERLPLTEITLVDLSQPMLARALERVGQKTAARVSALRGDIRDVDLPAEGFDVVVAAAVLHHLRDDGQWRQVFEKLFACLRPGGSLWISDLVEHASPVVQSLMWRRYGEYLVKLGGPEYRDKVYGYVEREDTPKPLAFQLDLLRQAGFKTIDVLHKNSVFAAFGAIK